MPEAGETEKVKPVFFSPTTVSSEVPKSVDFFKMGPSSVLNSDTAEVLSTVTASEETALLSTTEVSNFFFPSANGVDAASLEKISSSSSRKSSCALI